MTENETGTDTRASRRDLPWFEIVMGGGVLLISLISLFVAVSANRTQERMLAASVWPSLTFAASNAAAAGHRLRDGLFAKLGAQFVRQVRHGREILAAQQPFVKLLAPEGGQPQGFDEGGEFLRRHGEQVRHSLFLRIRAMKKPSAFHW